MFRYIVHSYGIVLSLLAFLALPVQHAAAKGDAIALRANTAYLAQASDAGKEPDQENLKVVTIHYDGLDWNAAGRMAPDEGVAEKLKMAQAIIDAWKKYGERLNNPALMQAEGLMKAIDAYTGKMGTTMLFSIACEIAGVDE